MEEVGKAQEDCEWNLLSRRSRDDLPVPAKRILSSRGDGGLTGKGTP